MIGMKLEEFQEHISTAFEEGEISDRDWLFAQLFLALLVRLHDMQIQMEVMR